MIFRKKMKYPLPKFPDTVAPTFKQLCVALPVEEVEALRPEVQMVLDKFEETATRHSNINLPMARDLGKCCQYLMENYARFDVEEQALIMGAVRYFAIAEDPFSEEAFATGFDDDARVMNHVLELLGLEDMYIEYR